MTEFTRRRFVQAVAALMGGSLAERFTDVAGPLPRAVEVAPAERSVVALSKKGEPGQSFELSAYDVRRECARMWVPGDYVSTREFEQRDIGLMVTRATLWTFAPIDIQPSKFARVRVRIPTDGAPIDFEVAVMDVERQVKLGVLTVTAITGTVLGPFDAPGVGLTGRIQGGAEATATPATA